MRKADIQVQQGAAHTSRLLLTVGHSRFLLALPAVVILAAIVAIFLSPADWLWKSGLLLALGLSAFAVIVVNRNRHHSGTLSLYSDGSACLKAGSGPKLNTRLLDHAWSTQWISVVTLVEQEHHKLYYCVVCASSNQAGEYRKLLRFLHMRSPMAQAHKVNGW